MPVDALRTQLDGSFTYPTIPHNLVPKVVDWNGRVDPTLRLVDDLGIADAYTARRVRSSLFLPFPSRRVELTSFSLLSLYAPSRALTPSGISLGHPLPPSQFFPERRRRSSHSHSRARSLRNRSSHPPSSLTRPHRQDRELQTTQPPWIHQPRFRIFSPSSNRSRSHSTTHLVLSRVSHPSMPSRRIPPWLP